MNRRKGYKPQVTPPPTEYCVKVTDDGLEHIVAMAYSLQDLAKQCGISYQGLLNNRSRAKKRCGDANAGIYKKIPMDEEDLVYFAAKAVMESSERKRKEYRAWKYT
jgi:hypothetical protein